MLCQGGIFFSLLRNPKYLALSVKELCAKDEDFKGILEKCSDHAYGLFHLENGFLFKGTWLCIPKSGFRELLIKELH